VATLTPSTAKSSAWPLAPGTYDVTAIYNGDAAHDDTASVSTPVTLTVTKADAAIKLSVPGATALDGGTLNATYGQPITVQVSAVAPGKAQATGTVQVSVDSGPPTDHPLTRGKAQLPPLGAGSYSLHLDYGGDDDLENAEATITVNVAQRVPALTLKVPANVASGKSATLTASIPGAPATGTVVFTVDGTPEPAVALTNNKATLKKVFPVGVHEVTASYSGDADNTAAAAGPASFTVT
jgi:hypothetical protein